MIKKLGKKQEEAEKETGKKITVPLTMTDTTGHIIGMFRQDWISGKVEGDRFELLSGAGCANPIMYFKLNGKQYTVDMRDVVKLLYAEAKKQK